MGSFASKSSVTCTKVVGSWKSSITWSCQQPSNNITLHEIGVCVYVCVCARVCVRTCTWWNAHIYLQKISHSNIWPLLPMYNATVTISWTEIQQGHSHLVVDPVDDLVVQDRFVVLSNFGQDGQSVCSHQLPHQTWSNQLPVSWYWMSTM